MLPIAPTHTSPCIRPMTSKRSSHGIDDDAESLASPPDLRMLAWMRSPHARPKAPKDCFYKSPPPTLSDRAARHERREKAGSDDNEVLFCALEKCDEEMLNFCRTASSVAPRLLPSEAP